MGHTRVGHSPLTQRQLIDNFFMEHRTQIIDLAAYLDRLDRAIERDAEDDFRYRAVREAMRVLSSNEPGRVERIQMALSDPSTEPLDTRDRQNALGAFSKPSEGFD